MGCPAAKTEKRASLRFDLTFPVLVSADGFGTFRCIARNISEGGMFLQTGNPLPLGSVIRIHFAMENGQDEIVALAEIKNHYYLSFSDGSDLRSVTGMGVKFVEFERDRDNSLDNHLTRYKAVH